MGVGVEPFCDSSYLEFCGKSFVTLIPNYNVPHLFLFKGLYEVNVIPTEDSDRLELTGNYLMTVRKEYLCLHSAKTGERVLEWELDHLPRFRLQRLSHLQDLDKVLTVQAAR